jgi:hypothetical protein
MGGIWSASRVPEEILRTLFLTVVMLRRGLRGTAPCLATSYLFIQIILSPAS